MSSGLKTALLLGGLSGLLMLFGGAFGGETGLVVAFVFALAMNGFSYWFSDKLVLKMYRAQQVGEDHPLHRLTARLAQRANLPMPKVYIIPDPGANAFATGRDPNHAAVAATEGILRLLPENELEGVIAHELSHIKNRDILISTVAATLAATIMFLAHTARWGMMFSGGGDDRDRRGVNPIVLLVSAILAPIAAMLIQMAISRQREFAADRGGADITGTPTGLASALRRLDAASKQIPTDASPATAHMFIVKPFTGEGMMSLFSSHPPTEARVKALLDHTGRSN
jgi:heat shock protein HtpX